VIAVLAEAGFGLVSGAVEMVHDHGRLDPASGAVQQFDGPFVRQTGKLRGGPGGSVGTFRAGPRPTLSHMRFFDGRTDRFRKP